jgi:hypothetical protein
LRATELPVVYVSRRGTSRFFGDDLDSIIVMLITN